MNVTDQIAQELKINPAQVASTLELTQAGDPLSFIARFRKARTGGLPLAALDKIVTRHKELEELAQQKAAVLKSLETQGKLTEPARIAIERARNKTEVDDVAAPLRQKKQSKGVIAIEQGLEPLADKIWEQQPLTEPLEALAQPYLDATKALNTAENVMEGVRAILAERIAAKTEVRQKVRRLFQQEAILSVKPAKSADDVPGKFAGMSQFSKPVSRLSDQDLLNIRRAVRKKVFKTQIDLDETKVLQVLTELIVKTQDSLLKFLLEAVIADAYHRILRPLIENDLRQRINERSDDVLGESYERLLENALMQPPLPGKRLLVVDVDSPKAYEAVVIDPTGQALKRVTLVFTPEDKVAESQAALKTLIDETKPDALVVSYSAAKDGAEAILRDTLTANDIVLPQIIATETAAHFGAESARMRSEFDDYSPTARRCVFLGRRVLDPLKELLKIDPVSIITGRPRREEEPGSMTLRLREIVSRVLSRLGVDLNTAETAVLRYVPGLDEVLAQAIVDHRAANGAFPSREALKAVAGMTDAIYVRAVGFLRVLNAANPLDATFIHPANYPDVDRIAALMNRPVAELLKFPRDLDRLDLDKLATNPIEYSEMRDLALDLKRGTRDTLPPLELITFDPKIREMTDLAVGQILKGRVTHLTEFGAFVNIGIKNDGLVHKTEMANQEIKDPTRYLRVGQAVSVKVLKIEPEKNRLELSMKAAQPAPQEREFSRRPERPQNQQQRPDRPPHQHAQGPSERGERDRERPRGDKRFPSDRRPARNDQGPRPAGPPKKVFGTLGDQFKSLLDKK